MSIKTEPNGQIVRQQPAALAPDKPATLAGLLSKMAPQMAMVLPKHVTPERMTRIALTALRTTKDLDKCTPASFLACIMSCSMLGLEPNTPTHQAYLIPFNNRRSGTVECTLIIGYEGYIDLMRRTGQVASTMAYAVYQGDFFEYELGLNPTLKHKPSEDPDRESRMLTHSYCVVRLKDKDAEPIFVVLPRSQIEKRRKRGASGRNVSTPWDTDYEEMAKKSSVRAIAKWAPKSAEVALAVDIEERNERNAPIAPALPPEVQEHLLTSGAVTEAEFVDSEPEQQPTEPQKPTREPGED